MPGETHLKKLLQSMTPELQPGDYVFCTLPEGTYNDLNRLQPLGGFQEKEGLTVIIERNKAEQAGLSFSGIFRCLTLQIHSSLEAVGLTAAVASALAEHHISANVIAAYYHDHIFVPLDRAEDALDILKTLAKAQK